MKEAVLSLHDSIAALATPPGTSALAVIRASGDDCIQKFSPLFASKKPITDVPAYSCVILSKEKMQKIILG